MNSKQVQTDEITKWIAKEINQLSNSTLRLALLAIIKKHQITGIYGYKIAEELHASTEGELDGTTATFYAILRRLENDHLVTSELKVSSTGPARKYYRLTPKGERGYNALWQNWIYFYGILNRLIEGHEDK